MAWWELIPEIALGIAISIASWLVTLFLIRPSFEISSEISRRDAGPNEDRKYVYRIKIRNRRRLRDAIDVSVACRVAATGFFHDRRKNLSYYTIPLGTTDLHRIKARRGRVFQLHVHKAEKLRDRLRHEHPELAAKFDEGTIRLEELLELPRARLYFYVSSHDSLSNSPAVDEHAYRKRSVAIGLFEKKTTKINPKTLKGYERDELPPREDPDDDGSDDDDRDEDDGGE